MDDLVISITLINNIFTMKRIGTLLSFIMLFAIVACTGDRGPQGPPGPPGPPGENGGGGGNYIGQVFETTVNFSSNNDYAVIVDFPSNIEVFESDAVLVYLLEEIVEGDIDVWAPLPQTFFVGGAGTMLYTFNHTFLDVKILLDADFPLNQLPSNFTQNQTFRIAVVPSEYADAELSMDELMGIGTLQWIE